MTLYDIPLTTLDGRPASLSDYKGEVLLVVNVASNCGYTSQYAGLEGLHTQYAAKGFRVLGFPCNQFLFQEPGGPEKIAQFCSVNYGVTFPLFEKTYVRGRKQHPLFGELVKAKTAEGKGGSVKWNFEKFLISREGVVLNRFKTKVEPTDAVMVEAVESALA